MIYPIKCRYTSWDYERILFMGTHPVLQVFYSNSWGLVDKINMFWFLYSMKNIWCSYACQLFFLFSMLCYRIHKDMAVISGSKSFYVVFWRYSRHFISKMASFVDKKLILWLQFSFLKRSQLLLMLMAFLRRNTYTL